MELPQDVPTQADLIALGEISAMVRGLVEPGAGWTPGALRILSRTIFELDQDGRLAAGGGGWAAFVGDLMLPLLEVVRLSDRLMLCGNPMCRLVFLDVSRNRTRRWCDDAGCGNRNRVKRYRGRQSTRGREPA